MAAMWRDGSVSGSPSACLPGLRPIPPPGTTAPTGRRPGPFSISRVDRGTASSTAAPPASACRASVGVPKASSCFSRTLFRGSTTSACITACKPTATTLQPTAAGTGVARSFLTIRFEPVKLISFDLNDNYFRSFPTFDPRLVGTGLLDKLLFQGVSGGVHLNLPYRGSFYATIGKSSGTGDPSGSWNQMYGYAMNDIMHSGIRADAHYSHFNSSFGRGDYESVSLSRDMRESLRLSVVTGQQNFVSQLTTQTRARFANGSLDWNFAAHYFLSGGVTVYRGQTQNYDQVLLTLGYRFSK